jgi:glutamate/tyrosine decarboxylase-like PLP-dependent enzyme
VPLSVQLKLTEAIAINDFEMVARTNELLDGLTQFIQKHQREQGKSFVSRTRIRPARYQRQHTTVFRVVLANPLTSHEILADVLNEQTQIAQLDNEFYPQLLAL